MPKASDDRILNPHGRRHYRRTYSTREVRIGLLILSVLMAIGAWVYDRGQHPDPNLFAAGAGLEDRPLGGAPGAPTDRGAMPDALTIEGYREGRISRFHPENLFEKINGRADFFKARGFAALTFLTLQHDDPNRSIDVELYDMGNAQNALGTYGAERSPDVTPERVPGAQFHREPNALFMARGPFYVRATAASGEDPVGPQLERLAARLHATIEGAQGPWSETLFVDGLGLDPADVGFVTENAFSFGFAKGVHTAAPATEDEADERADEDTQLFVVPTASESDAEALAARFADGFASYGEASTVDGRVFVADRYLSRVSTVAPSGRFVVGVVSARDQAAARDWLTKLLSALTALPEAVVARALSEVGAATQDTGADSAHAPEQPPSPTAERHEEPAHDR